MNPGDAQAMGVGDGDFVRVSSRRGSIELRVRLSHRDTPGTCFVPFHFREAAANLLTIDEIDPMGKIPEFKFCAVRIERAGGAALHEPMTAREGA
jgi:formate dehydrogenase major subunit